MLQRLKQVFSYLKGDLVVMYPKSHDTMVVDAGNATRDELKRLATALFKEAHNVSLNSK